MKHTERPATTGTSRRAWRPYLRVLTHRAFLGAAYTAGGLPLTLLAHWLITD